VRRRERQRTGRISEVRGVRSFTLVVLLQDERDICEMRWGWRTVDYSLEAGAILLELLPCRAAPLRAGRALRAM